MTLADSAALKKALLFSFDPVQVAQARAKIAIDPDQNRAIFIAERARVDFVYNTAALEDNPFTYPEVQTLIDGITVGGHKITDSEQVLRLNQALSHLIALIKEGKFEFTAQVAKDIQAITAKTEALKIGVFRDGRVSVGGSTFKVPEADTLDAMYEQGKQVLDNISDPIQKAFLLFLWGSLIQFFWDGNKRTSRFMCNGILMSTGYPPMMITNEEKLAYNQTMLQFYNTQDATEAMVWFYERYLERIIHFGFPLKNQAQGLLNITRKSRA